MENNIFYYYYIVTVTVLCILKNREPASMTIQISFCFEIFWLTSHLYDQVYTGAIECEGIRWC